MTASGSSPSASAPQRASRSPTTATSRRRSWTRRRLEILSGDRSCDDGRDAGSHRQAGEDSDLRTEAREGGRAVSAFSGDRAVRAGAFTFLGRYAMAESLGLTFRSIPLLPLVALVP